MSRNPKRGSTIIPLLLTVLILVFIIPTLCIDLVNTEHDPISPTGPNSTSSILPSGSDPTETVPKPEPEHVVSTATIGAMGDLLMHLPVVKTGLQSDGSYQFDSIFRYITEYTSTLDFAVANLETTLCGIDNGYSYSGYPRFNSPDAIVDGAKNAGFDLLLTANNHSYDTKLTGYKRTLEVVREKGLDTLGTMLTPEESKYLIKEVNGINIGMMCYTYASSVTDDGRPSLNGNSPVAEAGITNYFVYDNLNAFYSEVETYLAEMEEAGADATILYLHWGVEYQTYANDTQKAMAQKLCDLGVDVIIGGHPHVIQPVDLLESTVDPEHKTVIIYSLGNAVSNQRIAYMNLKTGHTEDGALFTVTFEKYSDGTAYVSDVDVLPTWVNMTSSEYNILPLDFDRVDEWQSLFDLTDSTLSSAQKSYDRTIELVGDGVEKCRIWLQQAKEDREEYYYDLAFHPEKFTAEAQQP